MIETLVIVSVVLITGIILAAALWNATDAITMAMIKSALIANFNRFGDSDVSKIVVVNDERAYFIRDSTLWVCDVQDDMIVRTSARPVDVMAVQGEDLKEVMAAVDALNSDFEEEGTE